MNLIQIILLSCLAPLGTQSLLAEGEPDKASVPEEFKPYIYAAPESVEWFEDARYGVFVHWGPYVLAEVPASWGRHGPRPGAGRQANGGVPQKEYDQLYKSFNPVEFDADEWIRMVKDSGARYFIFTTKHHDGFCMFDARNTDYKITNTPFGRDVARELAEACHKHGIKLFWYYSQPDWSHPDCLTENNERYREYMYAHLEQLLTEYGPVAGLFFDGLGTRYDDWDTPRMLKLIRTWQPDILVNARWGGGMPGYPRRGDYQNPEQEVGHFEIDNPWEACMTMSEAWSWTGGDQVKTFRNCLRLLIQCAGSGGNLALNTGPTPQGTINPPEKENYRRIGEWMRHYEKSIRGTTGGPYKPAPWGVSTRKGNRIFLHILPQFVGSPEIVIPPLPVEITNYTSLTGGKVRVLQSPESISISLDPESVDPIDNIVVLTVAGDALDLPVIDPVAAGEEIDIASADASSAKTGKNSLETMLARAEGDFVEGKKHKGWWAAKNNDRDPWIRIDFGREMELNYITLSEQIRNCSTRRFVIEYLQEGQWEILDEGSEIGMDFSLKVPVTATASLRLRFLENAFGQKPNLLEIRAYRL